MRHYVKRQKVRQKSGHRRIATSPRNAQGGQGKYNSVAVAGIITQVLPM
jgi:hypothetical protein